jgi:putative two-component system hydrogenase maturation factor HypX/HoxX
VNVRILLLAQSFNSLTQRLHVELEARGHEVSVELDTHFDVVRQGIALFSPDVVLASFLKRAIPADIWRTVRCLIVHPGVPGDRGPAALDWAMLERRSEWGATVIEAVDELDAGPIWGTASFPMREATKSSLYRREVTDAAVAAVDEALARIAGCRGPRMTLGEGDLRIAVRGPCRQEDRRIDWLADDTATVLRKIHSADGVPGVLDDVEGVAVRLFDAHSAPGLTGKPGRWIAKSNGALARATVDGAIWIGHMKTERSMSLKLPAEEIAPEVARTQPIVRGGYDPIRYWEAGDVGCLSFAFYNGAMSTSDCLALRDAVVVARARPTRVLLLLGGPDFWSNGIHLGKIEAAASPADESWRNINAMNDLAQTVIETTDRLVVAMMRGNAGAGGVFMALAADEVWAESRIVLNPHYKDMGNLYGSEYWTYLLPRRVAPDQAASIMRARLPMGATVTRKLGLVDRIITPHGSLSDAPVDGAVALTQDLVQDLAQDLAQELARDPGHAQRVAAKQARRAADEAARPLAAYRNDELHRMRLNFYGFDPSYHVARHNFIYKIPKSRTPLTLARHRTRKNADRGDRGQPEKHASAAP